MNKGTLATLCITSLGVMGCGGSSSGPVVFEADDLASDARILSEGVGDAGDVLANGDTLTARTVTVAASTLDYRDDSDGDTSILENAPTLAIRMNEIGELTLIIDDVEQNFTVDDEIISGDGVIYGYSTESTCESEGICNSLFSWSGTLEEFKQIGNGYSKAFLVQNNTFLPDKLDIRAYGIIGTETGDSALVNLGQATFSGFSNLNIFPATGWENFESSMTRIRSDANVTVDFAEGSVSGSLDNLRLRGPGDDDYADIPGSIIMEESLFTGNGYSGTLSASSDLGQDTNLAIAGSYSGAFYGDAAQETAGVFSAAGSDDELGDFNSIGFFRTSEDN